jgi:hypothetical protein
VDEWLTLVTVLLLSASMMTGGAELETIKRTRDHGCITAEDVSPFFEWRSSRTDLGLWPSLQQLCLLQPSLATSEWQINQLKMQC